MAPQSSGLLAKITIFLESAGWENRDVKSDFIMNIPFFWSPAERVGFLDKVDRFFIRHKSLATTLYNIMLKEFPVISMLPRNLASDEVFASVWGNFSLPLDACIFRFMRNILIHYLGEFRDIQLIRDKTLSRSVEFWVPNDSEVERLIAQSCPEYEKMYQYFRFAIVSRSINCTEDLKQTMLWVQEGFLSETRSFDEVEGHLNHWLER